MLIEKLAGLLTVRRRMVAFRLGCAMGKPLLGGVMLGLAPSGPLSRGPQINNFSHS